MISFRSDRIPVLSTRQPPIFDGSRESSLSAIKKPFFAGKRELSLPWPGGRDPQRQRAAQMILKKIKLRVSSYGFRVTVSEFASYELRVPGFKFQVRI